MRIVAIILAVSVVALAMPLPGAGSTPVDAADYAVCEALALRRAEAEWPGSRLGSVIPYLDPDGTTCGYMFHFRTDGLSFPDYDEVRADVLEDRSRLGPNTDLSSWESDYAYVLVSNRYDRAPMPCFGYGTSEFYAIGEEAVERASGMLSGELTVSRVYFVFPRVYLEVSNRAGERVVMSNHFEQTWDSRESFRDDVRARKQALEDEFPIDRKEIARLHRQEWDRALVSDFTDYSESYAPGYEQAPFYDWSYGCTPTASAMVMGWVDKTQNYGRIVDWYWQRYDMVEGQMDWQIPNVQRECAIAMHTDTTTGGTQIFRVSPGLREVASDNGYNFTTVSQQGGSYNDWAWQTIMSEINSGYGFVWSALWEIHSLSCFGYRTDDKYVYVHNTWWQPAAWWSHSGDDWSYVDSPHPGGANPRKLEVTFPLGDTNYSSIGGGEVLQVGDTTQVTWDNFGNPGTKVDIDWSTNGGLTWQGLVSNTDDDGSYDWYLAPSTPACDTVRIRLKQYQSSTYTSGDGSFGCFSIAREPKPPVSLAPPNGRQLMDPPVVLLVDSTRDDIDSFDFRVMRSTDTIWWQKADVPKCSLPDTLFEYGRSYKWVCRGHNEFGWGEFNTPWSFWCRFNSGVEEGPGQPVEPELGVAAVQLPGGGVAFNVGRPGPDAELRVYDALGVLRARLDADRAETTWDRRDRSGSLVPAGLYFVRLENDNAVVTGRFVLLD